MQNLIPFLSYVFVMTFTPGPNNIISMINAGNVGIKKGIKFNIGVFFGCAVVMILCAAFGAAVSEYIPVIKPYLVYVGAAYILYLAYKIFKSSSAEDRENDQSIYGVRDGMMLQFVNPKVILFGITTYSTFILPNFSNIFVLILFTVMLTFVGFTATLCWTLFGSVFQKILKRHGKLVNAVLALILVYTAVSLFL